MFLSLKDCLEFLADAVIENFQLWMTGLFLDCYFYLKISCS